MPHDPQLAQEMRTALADVPGIVEKRMFGGYCWMLRGNMLCGVEVGRFMFRVGKDLYALALARPGAKPMAITGKPMAGFVWVQASAAKGASLKLWIDLATQYVSALPPK
jgi:TfoX/Sxy family transcriptional regulator of competence genes